MIHNFAPFYKLETPIIIAVILLETEVHKSRYLGSQSRNAFQTCTGNVNSVDPVQSAPLGAV